MTEWKGQSRYHPNELHIENILVGAVRPEVPALALADIRAL